MTQRNQRGMTLISVLAALLIFVFGLLALAGLYSRLMAAQTGNEMMTSTQTYGNRFWALLQADGAQDDPALLAAHPPLLQSLIDNSSAATCPSGSGASVAYQASTIGNAPTGLQPLLTDMFKSPLVNLPGATVTFLLCPDATSTACSATQCGVTMSLQWTPPGSPQRTQVFNYQAGGF